MGDFIERSIDPHEVLWMDMSSTWMDPRTPGRPTA